MRRPSFCFGCKIRPAKTYISIEKRRNCRCFSARCNSTDAWLPGLNSLRFSRLRIDRGWAFPYSPSLMRPCDGTSGLVRKNRRKAVFAFKGLFPKGICHVFALGQWVLSPFSEVRETGNLRAQPDFYQQNRRAQVQDCCLVDRSRFFTALPEAFVSGMRLALEPLSATVFRIQEPQVDALCHSGVIGLLFLLILFLFYLAAIVVLPQG